MEEAFLWLTMDHGGRLTLGLDASGAHGSTDEDPMMDSLGNRRSLVAADGQDVEACRGVGVPPSPFHSSSVSQAGRLCCQ